MNNRVPLDAFALEELRRRYLSADVNGRIALLQDNTLPFEIARMAVDDPKVEVRQWFARHGRDYRESFEDGTGHFTFHFPDRSLLEILRNDRDRFVRASVYLNPAFSPFLDALATAPGHALVAALAFGSRQKMLWSQATHFERLAMARSGSFSSELSKLFDLKDNELGLSVEERRELISAFLAGRSGHDASRDSESKEIWELVPEWPQESDVPPLVYRFLPASDEAAAKVYGNLKKPEWRRAILCMVWDAKEREENEARVAYLYRSTLDLAIKDADPACRLLGYAEVCIGENRYWKVWGSKDRALRRKESRKLRRAARDDIYALAGLLRTSRSHRANSTGYNAAHTIWSGR